MQDFFSDMFSYPVALFSSFFGDFHFLGLFLVSLILLILLSQYRKRSLPLILYSLFTLFLFVFPVFSNFVTSYAGGDTYWRVLWLIPLVPVTAYGFTALTASFRIALLRPFLAALFLFIVYTTGNFFFTEANFQKTENPYKLPNEVLEICDVILEDHRGDAVQVVFPEELFSYVRQYTSEIQLSFGRSSLQTGVFPTQEDQTLYHIMNNEEETVTRLVQLVEATRCDYLVISASDPRTDNLLLRDYGLSMVYETDNYRIFRASILRVTREDVPLHRTEDTTPETME